MTREAIPTIAYIIIAWMTFGWVAASPECQGTSGGPISNIDCVFGGIMGGAAWPLYWMWEAAELVRS